MKNATITIEMEDKKVEETVEAKNGNELRNKMNRAYRRLKKSL